MRWIRMAVLPLTFTPILLTHADADLIQCSQRLPCLTFAVSGGLETPCGGGTCCPGPFATGPEGACNHLDYTCNPNGSCCPDGMSPCQAGCCSSVTTTTTLPTWYPPGCTLPCQRDTCKAKCPHRHRRQCVRDCTQSMKQCEHSPGCSQMQLPACSGGPVVLNGRDQKCLRANGMGTTTTTIVTATFGCPVPLQ